MPTGPYHHGVSITEVNDGARTLRRVSTAVIGLVATGPAANAGLFPLNKPVLITDLPDAISKAGESGTLHEALQAIADQTKPIVVVVRVAPGVADEDTTEAEATNANVIGGTVNGLKTGMQALLAAEAQLGVKPRIIGCPGLDTQPVTTALVIVAKKLRAMAYAKAIGADIAARIAYRNNFSARELMLITPDFVAFDQIAESNARSFAVARALGLRARIDEEQGFHKTLSNVPVDGVLGLTEDIQFDIQDPDTEAGLLNAGDITTLVHANGYRFWGGRTCSDDPLFAFESTTRTAQVLMDTIAGGMMWAIDKPLRPSLVKDIVETINNALRGLKRDGMLIGGNAWFDPEKNTADVLSAGKVVIDYDFTPVPPLENLLLNQRITDSYLHDFSASLVGE